MNSQMLNKMKEKVVKKVIDKDDMMIKALKKRVK
jgi:hypothetical protein